MADGATPPCIMYPFLYVFVFVCVFAFPLFMFIEQLQRLMEQRHLIFEHIFVIVFIFPLNNV